MENTKKKNNLFVRLLKGKYNNPFKVKLFIACLIAIPLIAFAIFVVYGNFGGIVQAFRKREVGSLTEYWTYENFAFLYNPLKDGGILVKTDMFRWISNAIGYLFVFMFISVPISIVCSFFLYKKVPFSKMIVVLLFMPNIIPLSVLGLYFKELVTPGGILYEIMNNVLGLNIQLSDTTGNVYLYMYTVYFGFGYNAILIWGAMTRIPEEIVESANLDGANLIVEFFRITVPMSWATMSMVIVLSWMVPFTIYSQPMMIAGESAKDTKTWALHVMLTTQTDQYQAAAYSVVAACISLPTTLLLQKALEKVFPVVEV